jgi:glycosyltransferase involved in cell wall biosynthesis
LTSVAIHVDQLFYQVPGGIGTYVRHLLPALREAKPELDLSLFHARFRDTSPQELDGFRPIDLERGIRALYPMWNWAGRPALPVPLDRADVIHAPSPVAIPPTGPRQKLVVTVHDLAFRVYPQAYPPAWRLLHRAGLRRALRKAAAIIAVSRSTASDVARLGGGYEGPIHVVPLGGSIPVGTEDPSAALERLRVPRPYVLFVGTLEPRKNLIRLIRAYRRTALRVPHALVLAGPLGWRSEPIRRELAVRGHGRVVATGRLSEADLDALYRGADAFVYPSMYEGFGLPVLDAMIRGVPVVTSNTSSLPELVGEAAIQVSPSSTASITTALDGLLTDPGERSRLSAAGREKARGYSWERTARATLNVYEEVLAS